MNSDIERYISLLEQRLSLLHRLSQLFIDCRTAFIAMDLDGMHGYIQEQETLCHRIRVLHRALDSLQQACHPYVNLVNLEGSSHPADEALNERLRRVISDSGIAQAEVARLSGIHVAFLGRSRQTIDILLISLGQFALTYGPQGQPVSPEISAR